MAIVTHQGEYSVDEMIYTLQGLGFRLTYKGTDHLTFSKGNDRLSVAVPDPGASLSKEDVASVLNSAVSIVEKRFPSLKS